MAQQRRHPRQVHAQVTDADDPRFAGIGVPGHLHAGGGGAAAIPVAAPPTENERWDQLHTNLLEEGNKPTRIANAKRVMSRMAGGDYRSKYQQVLDSVSNARATQVPSERHAHLKKAQELTDQWHEKRGKDNDRGRALTHLGTGLKAELPTLLEGMVGEHETEQNEKSRRGLRYRTAYADAEIHGREHDKTTHRKLLGAGAMNEVFSTKFGADPKMWVTKAEESKSNMGVLNSMGINRKDPEFSRRNVATFRGAKAFGMDVIPETHFTKEQHGALGTAMEMAPGKSPIETKQAILGRSRAERQGLLAHFDGLDGEDAQLHQDVIDGQGLKLHGSGAHRVVTSASPKYRPGGIDMRHPTTQQQLLQLQGLDFVTQAGADRHGSNYFVAPGTRRTEGGSSVHTGGQVKGIDNDASWGIGNLTAAGSHSQGLPPALHEHDAARFEQMTPERLKTALGATVTREEFQAATGRLDELKAHIGALRERGKVLKQEHFGPNLYDDLKAQQSKAKPDRWGRRPDDAGDSYTSYIGRDGHHMEDSAASRLQHNVRYHRRRKQQNRNSAANLLQRNMQHHLRRKQLRR
jgi:hypothetical protein